MMKIFCFAFATILVQVSGDDVHHHGTQEVFYTLPKETVERRVYTVRMQGPELNTANQQPVVQTYVRPNIEDRRKLESPRVTTWGDWSNWFGCNDDQFVTGMQLSTEKPTDPNVDNTALNAIRLFCSNPRSNDLKELVALESPWGTWGSKLFCPGLGVGIGFQLRSMARNPTDTVNSDNSAGNNFRLICDNQVTLTGDGSNFGDWSEPQICSCGEALCGFRTQVEPSRGAGRSGAADDTSLNNVDAVCCKRN